MLLVIPTELLLNRNSMAKMNNIFTQLIDLKLSIAGFLFMAITFSDAEVVLKIIASILMIGYTARRWYLFEQQQQSKQKEDETN